MQVKILLIRFFSLFALIAGTASISFREILGREDYAIVGIDDCMVSVEVGVEDSKCVYHMTGEPKRINCLPHFSLLYLPQDQNSTIPPKILKIIQSNNDVVYNLQDIVYPGNSISKTNLEFGQYVYLKRNEGRYSSISFNLVFGVLYNHRSGILYILSYVDDLKIDAVADVYYMYQEKEYPFKLTHEYLTRTTIDKIFMGTQWSTDPYTGQFYCHRSEFNRTLGRMVSRLYSIPFDMILTNLKKGVLGKLEKDFGQEIEKQRDFVQVTNGLVYSQGENHRLISSLYRRVRGSRCSFPQQRKRDFFFVLTGWEYCKIRDREYANITTCMQQGSHFQPLSECSNSLLWTIAIAVIANAVILLVILCVVCKYYKHEDHDNGLYMNSHPTKVRTALITPDELFEKRRLNSSVIDI